MNKVILNAQSAKKEFVKSIHNWLMNTLDKNNKSEYKDNFKLQDASILCDIPSDYFDHFEIPEGLKIEIKFTVKKS